MSGFRVTAQVEPYVDALGLDLAVKFLLAFGGTEVYLSEKPKEDSQVVSAIGREGAIALARRIGSGPCRVHTAKPFLASYFRYMKDWSVVRIARELHMSEVSIRKWLGPRENPQLDLFAS